MWYQNSHWVWAKANTAQPEVFEGTFAIVDTMRGRRFEVDDARTYGKTMVFVNPRTQEAVTFIQTEVKP